MNMRLLVRASSIGFAMGLVALQMLPASAGVVEHSTIPFDGTLTNFCNGDQAELIGTAKILGVSTLPGGVENVFHITLHATGVGVPSGESYVDEGIFDVSSVADPNGGASVDIIVIQNRLISQGPQPNEIILQDGHLTFDANGDLTAVFFRYSLACTG